MHPTPKMIPLGETVPHLQQLVCWRVLTDFIYRALNSPKILRICSGRWIRIGPIDCYLPPTVLKLSNLWWAIDTHLKSLIATCLSHGLSSCVYQTSNIDCPTWKVVLLHWPSRDASAVEPSAVWSRITDSSKKLASVFNRSRNLIGRHATTETWHVKPAVLNVMMPTQCWLVWTISHQVETWPGENPWR